MDTAAVTKKELFYNSIAGDFDNVMSRYEVGKRYGLIFNKLLKGKLKGKTLLDAGSGTGIFSQGAVERGAIVTSLDVGEDLLNQVAKKCQSKRVVGSVTELPFGDDIFDIVLATEVIEHTIDPQRAIRELCRVVKPGGILLITVPNKIWKFYVSIADWFKIRPYHGHENWIFWSDLKNGVRREGMKIQTTFGFNILPFFHPWLQPIITICDSLGDVAGPLMVNMGVLCVKNPPAKR